MTAAALMADLTAAGLSLDPPDNLRLRGDRATRARWLPQVRERKAELVELLTATAPDTATCRQWLVRHQDGTVRSHSFCPPASRQEVESWYPDARSIEPEAPDV